MTCRHNQRCRYTDGFYCEDCETYFHKDSPIYRSSELLSSIYFALHNINAQRLQDKQLPYEDVKCFLDMLGFGKKHENYEELIVEAKTLLSKYGKDSESASVTIK